MNGDLMSEAARYIQGWPEQSREAAQLVLDQYGDPNEKTDSQLVYHPGPWKRIVASKAFFSIISQPPYQFGRVGHRLSRPPDKFSELAKFDGSVIVERSAGEVSARCHDEQANFLALNLMHDIVTGAKNVQAARAKEFADYRRRNRGK